MALLYRASFDQNQHFLVTAIWQLMRQQAARLLDQFGRSSDPAYFCTGNLLRPVETSSWCWHEAVETAHRLAQDLNHSPKGNQDFVELRTAHPAIKFVLPQRLIIGDNSNAMTHMANPIATTIQW